MSYEWDRRYSDRNYLYGEAPNGFLTETAGLIPAGGPVLCLAEGEGRNACHLAALGHRVLAVDQSAVGLTKARALAARLGVAERVETVVADLATFLIEPGRWAGVVAIFAHLPPALRAEVHGAAVRGLRTGGVFLLEAYTPGQLRWRTGGPIAQPELLMTARALRGELAPLVFERILETERDVIEGTGHRGRAAVVQVVGRKGQSQCERDAFSGPLT